MELVYRYFVFGNEEQQKSQKWRFYSASIKNLQSTSSQIDEIELVKAKHIPSYGKRNVQSVVIKNSKIFLIPRIDKHFTHLAVLEIVYCSLQEISKEDLQPFKSTLRLINVAYNLIKSLPADLFDGMTCIVRLQFRNNKIRFISQQTLTPLLRLKFADFRENETIDDVYDSYASPSGSIALSLLRAKIVVQCAPPDEQMSTVSSYVHNLWQGDFFDFKITARKKVFNVHRAVLAVNSPVFAAMFSHKMEENMKNEVMISNFSPDTVKEFLTFVYLRETPQNCFDAADLYAMAEEYQVKELSARIQWHIAVEVTAENATEMFKLGALYNNDIIKQTAFQEIEKSLHVELPANLMQSLDDMMEVIEAKDKLDEIVKRATQTHTRN